MRNADSNGPGMFLYARLVCDSIEMLGDIESIQEAVDHLPDGLNEALVPRISSNRAQTYTFTCIDTTEFFIELQKAWKTANARTLDRF